MQLINNPFFAIHQVLALLRQVSRDMGYRSDSILISRDMGPRSQYKSSTILVIIRIKEDSRDFTKIQERIEGAVSDGAFWTCNL